MAKNLFVEYNRKYIPGGTVLMSEIRPANEKDIQSAQLALEHGKCTHDVVWDQPGHMYDLRFCNTCGSLLGLI